MAEEEIVDTVAAAEAPATEAQVETAAPAEGVETELTLTEKVAADEAGDAVKFAALEEKVAKLESGIISLCAQIQAAHDRVDAVTAQSPAATNEKLEASVAKMHEKMKLLIPMED